jgi:hypothetical protein
MTRLTAALALLVASMAATAAAQVAPVSPVAPVPPVPSPLPLPAPVRIPDFSIDVPDINVDIDFPAFSLQVPVPSPPNAPRPPNLRPFFDRGGNQEERLYEQARAMIEANQYDKAVPAFDRVIAAAGTRTDAAMYWKAYSLFKLARRADALATLADLQKMFPMGAWLKDARALELEVKQASGQPVTADAANDDELRLLALRGILQTDGDAALPVIEKMLNGPANVRVKDRALFLLAQSRSPRAREVVASVAKGTGNPDLQRQAIRYLSMLGATAELSEIARNEKNPELRRAAIRSLGMTGEGDVGPALTAIYNAGDSSTDDKKAVIDALGMRNNAPALVALARNEKNGTLKTEIVRRLSVMKAPEAREYMLELLK